MGNRGRDIQADTVANISRGRERERRRQEAMRQDRHQALQDANRRI